MSDDVNIQVKLAEILGEIKLTNQKLDTLAKDVGHLTADQATLEARVKVLEERDNIRVGERQGIGLAAKVLPFIGGGAVAAVAALVARAMGL